MASQPEISAKVNGLVETKKKMEQIADDLKGPDMTNAVMSAATLVMRDARTNAPVNTGQLKNSIIAEIRPTMNNVQGVVGSNLKHAPWMELGTGTFAGNSRYFPPPASLELWAKRHGTTGYAVARAIFMRGGLKPRKYLQKAFEKNRPQIVKLIGNAVGRIVSK